MKYFIIMLMSILVVSCSIGEKKQERLNDWNLFSQLEIGKDNQESVRIKLGNPAEIDTEDLELKEEQWNYMRRDIPKIGVFFVDGILRFSSMDVWNGEAVADLAYLLKEFSGEWKIVKEEPVSPHFMPFICYLIDEKNGVKIEIHGYKKIVESIYKWSPQFPPKKSKKVKTYPDVDPNRCAWLKDYIKNK